VIASSPFRRPVDQLLSRATQLMAATFASHKFIGVGHSFQDSSVCHSSESWNPSDGSRIKCGMTEVGSVLKRGEILTSSARRYKGCALRVEYFVSPPIRGRVHRVARKSEKELASSPFRRPSDRVFERAHSGMAATFDNSVQQRMKSSARREHRCALREVHCVSPPIRGRGSKVVR